MFKFVSIVVATIMVTSSFAFADQRPKSLPSDGRIKQFVYKEDTVYRLDLHLKGITPIQLGRGEKIQSILAGDSSSFEITPLKSGNVFSVKPRVAGAVSNLTVFTNRRVYTFSLNTVGTLGRSRHNSGQNFRVSFIYATSSDVVEVSGSGGSDGQNFDYFAAGKTRFNPIEVFDNGKQTFFRFSENAPLPTIFKVDENGKESLVNVRANGKTLVVDSVGEIWTARIGDEALCVASGTAIKTLPRRVRRLAGLS